MGPCCHPRRKKICALLKNADMHLTLGFLRSNTDFGSPWLLIFDSKTIKKPLQNRLPLGATLFFNFLWIRCHLGRQHDTQDLAKTPQHSSRGHPRAAQEP